MIETNGDVKTNEVLVFFENKRIGLKALTNLLQAEGKIFIRGNKSFQQKGHLGGTKMKNFQQRTKNFQQRKQKLSAISKMNKMNEELSAKGTKVFSKD